MKKFIHPQYENNVDTVVVEHGKIYILTLLVVDDELDIPSTLLNKPSNKLNLFKKKFEQMFLN